MEQLFGKVHRNIAAKRPCVVYCKPAGNVVTGIFQHDDISYPVDYSCEGFVFAPFSDGNIVFIPHHKADVLVAEIENIAFDWEKDEMPKIDVKAKADFETLVTNSIEAIRSGKFEKLVCSRNEIVPIEADIFSVFMKMISLYPNAFRYCFYHPSSGLWMGATPEQLLKSESNTIYTVGLAGTQLYDEGKEAVWQEKEKQEQQFVTDYIVYKLNSLLKNIKISLPYSFRAGNLVHIKTDISADITSDVMLEDVIKILHPTPAVCGLPTERAMQFLKQNEGYDRQYYSGFLGEVNRDFTDDVASKTDLFVNLRCMRINVKTARLFVGCGITKDSNPEKEFFETVNKSMTMKRVL